MCFRRRPPLYERSAPIAPAELAERRDAIRGAIKHAWRGYADAALGKDSVAPVSGRPVNSGFDMAVTLVDSLDTLWLVGLREEFAEARAVVAGDAFRRKLARPPAAASVFETTIRVLGGLLGAYELSRDRIFVDRAVVIGDAIFAKIDARTGVVPPNFGGRGGGCPSLAHAGTTQLELVALSRASGDEKYARLAKKFYAHVRNQPRLEPGLYPQCVGAASGKITLGAEADSFYEYLPKIALMDGANFGDVWPMYDAAMEGMERHLVQRGDDGLLYLDNLQWRGGSAFRREAEMEHLACFVPGMVVLGLSRVRDAAARKKRLDLADDLARTCFAFYDRQPTKIGPERVKGRSTDLRSTNTREYILRPEAAEGWWYLSVTPGLEDRRDEYRDWGWQSFSAIDAQLRVPHGHASLRDVTRAPVKGGRGLDDKMESFWIAETLKYFYLLQEEHNPLPLDKYVFNTEAHPFAIAG